MFQTMMSNLDNKYLFYILILVFKKGFGIDKSEVFYEDSSPNLVTCKNNFWF